MLTMGVGILAHLLCAWVGPGAGGQRPGSAVLATPRSARLGTAARRPSPRLATEAATAAATAEAEVPAPVFHEAVIVGGGPAGLATAIMLARRGWTDIHVYDRLPPPPEPDDEQTWSDTARFYLIGLGGRGQKALAKLGAWDEVRRYANVVTGRKDWSPETDPEEGVERRFTDRNYLTQVLPRDRLAGALHRLVRTEYAGAVTLHHGLECRRVEWDKSLDEVTLELEPFTEAQASTPTPAQVTPAGAALAAPAERARVRTTFLIGADGTARSIATEAARVTRDVRVVRYEDDNRRVYKTVPLTLPLGWGCDLNYSARTKDGRVNFDALPASAKGDYCGVLLMRAGDPLAKGDTDPAELRALLDDSLPQFSALLDDEAVAVIAQKPPSALPSFRYVGPRLRVGRSTALLGDAIHTVKPYFGLGANSAFEDVTALGDALDRAQRELPGAPRAEVSRRAIERFSRERSGEARALVRLSRDLDRPGLLGFLTFILPLILDGLFAKAAPWLFRPNVIAMLQKEDFTFQRIARRKRLDRAVQAAILASLLTAAAAAVAAALRAALATVVGRRAGLAAAAVAAAALVRKVASSWLAPGLTPGDILARLSRTDNTSALMQQRMSQPGYGEPKSKGPSPSPS